MDNDDKRDPIEDLSDGELIERLSMLKPDQYNLADAGVDPFKATQIYLQCAHYAADFAADVSEDGSARKVAALAIKSRVASLISQVSTDQEVAD